MMPLYQKYFNKKPLKHNIINAGTKRAQTYLDSFKTVLYTSYYLASAKVVPETVYVLVVGVASTAEVVVIVIFPSVA